MNKPFIFGRPDTCPKCNKSRSLEVYNRFDKPMNYSFILDRHEDISKRMIDISYIKCKRCHERFFPRWDNEFIYPMEDINERDFMAYYKANKDK